MSREWRPGDVVRVRYDDLDQIGVVRPRKEAGGALEVAYGSGGFDMIEERDQFGFARPLVTIDPEDVETVERLWRAYLSGGEDGMRPVAALQAALQAALREFANPTPPKPEEPLGLGAVVEDAEGQTWLRDWKGVWRAPDVTARWSKVAAVRVLSPGVEGDS